METEEKPLIQISQVKKKVMFFKDTYPAQIVKIF